MMPTITKIRVSALSFSLLLSLLAFITDDLINSDGILYLDMAKAYLNGGLSATAELYNWPFFPILIAYVHKITSLTIEHSAYLTNGLLFALFIDSFIKISIKILPNTRQVAIATILILCLITLNDYRDYIIRDVGYWAFCSLLLYRFMLFLETPSFKNASLWQFFALTAVLFRVEGAIILLGLPLYLFFEKSFNQALKQALQLNYLFILGLIVIGVFSISSSSTESAFGKLGNISSYLQIEQYLSSFHQKAEVMMQQVLSPHSTDYDGGLILISGLLTLLAFKIIKGISISYIAVYALSFRNQNPPKKHPYLSLLYYFSALNILILTVFILSLYFVTTRYCIMAIISILLLMLPRLCQLIESLWEQRKKALLYLFGALLVLGLIDSVTTSRPKSYIKNTAIWASDNIPRNSKVLTDNRFIKYYFNSHQPLTKLSLESLNSYLEYDYLVVVEKRKNLALKESLSTMNIEPIFTESSKRGDKAIVYKISP